MRVSCYRLSLPSVLHWSWYVVTRFTAIELRWSILMASFRDDYFSGNTFWTLMPRFALGSCSWWEIHTKQVTRRDVMLIEGSASFSKVTFFQHDWQSWSFDIHQSLAVYLQLYSFGVILNHVKSSFTLITPSIASFGLLLLRWAWSRYPLHGSWYWLLPISLDRSFLWDCKSSFSIREQSVHATSSFIWWVYILIFIQAR